MRRKKIKKNTPENNTIKIKKRKSKSKNLLANIFYLLTISFLFGVFLILFAFVYFAKDLPRPERYSDRPMAEPTRIYDRTGEHVLYTIYGEEKRELTIIENVPEHFINTLLTAEDKNFYNHYGIDFYGIMRSALMNLQTGRTVAGGSTISQQFVRAALLTPEKKVMRKVREIVLTFELERRYDKDEILEFYLNQIPFGSNAYGIESATQTFFNKTVNDITLAESATIVSVIPAPSFYSPYGPNLDKLMQKKDNLLRRMYEEGVISKEELDLAIEEEVVFHYGKDYLQAPHAVMRVKSDLEKLYGEDFLKEEGLKVYTTIDFEKQKEVEKILKERVAQNRRFNSYNGAVVVIDPNTGEVIALVGSVDYFGSPYPEGCTPGKNCYFDPQTDVTDRMRQPGSAFKPFVYATAFENGYSGRTTVIDEPTNFGSTRSPYVPRNYDGMFRGEVTLRESLAQSLNVPSIKVLRDLAGLELSVENAKKFGINLPYSASFYGLPLVLGGGDVKLLEITSAYGVFATNGLKNDPFFILKIIDKDGNTIQESKPSLRQVLNPSVAREITDILSDNEARAPVFGWYSPLYFPYHNIAAKTGSTQNFRDAWCIGYSKDFVVGVWTGNNDNTSMVNAPGVNVAAPIWKEVIQTLL